MTDLGFSQSAANDMTARVSRGDNQGALIVFQSLAALVYSVAAAGIVASAFLAAFFPLNRFIHFKALPIGQVRLIIWLFSVEVFMKLAEGPNNAGLRAYGDYALSGLIYATSLLVQNVSVWLVAFFGYGPLLAALSFSGVRFIATPAVAVFLLNRHKFLSVGFRNAKISELRKLLRPALANIAMPLAQAFNIQGMLLVVGAVLGPVAVVTFSVLRTLSRLVLQLAWGVSHSFEPELSVAWGRRDMALLQKLYVYALRAGFWLAVFAGLTLYVFGNWIVRRWTHGMALMDSRLFHWLLLSSASSILWYSGLIVLKSSNAHLRAAVLYLVISATGVGAALLLLHLTGRLADTGMALIVIDVGMIIYVMPQASYATDLPLLSTIVRLFYVPVFSDYLFHSGRRSTKQRDKEA